MTSVPVHAGVPEVIVSLEMDVPIAKKPTMAAKPAATAKNIAASTTTVRRVEVGTGRT
ncbi:MAG: hypothetical protein ABIS91_02385 [Nocardioides sp.]|uniref:hypothetical protein n=1 Tax=Nocardioides sp. TaxID=35761 RepID=UPI0032672C2B